MASAALEVEALEEEALEEAGRTLCLPFGSLLYLGTSATLSVQVIARRQAVAERSRSARDWRTL